MLGGRSSSRRSEFHVLVRGESKMVPVCENLAVSEAEKALERRSSAGATIKQAKRGSCFYPGQPRQCFRCGSRRHLASKTLTTRCVHCVGPMATSVRSAIRSAVICVHPWATHTASAQMFGTILSRLVPGGEGAHWERSDRAGSEDGSSRGDEAGKGMLWRQQKGEWRDRLRK
ncbi:complex III assembly factor LYRM7 isoform X1 [Xenopus laevis]|uniref:Complex III assembly factor LYRM7 isoform X1 n=1 Tax=Xenopus laevis TaxID=8355 RepID=A0A8J0UKY9_XENLA|nr:complex III assembly factor LYRM7 isoform X1 [Xenopus laevis]